MACSQKISMNCSPPRAMDPSRLAAFPAAKARILNRPSANIGSAMRVSITQNRARMTAPPIRPDSTIGLVQPVAWPPYGWMP